jgi:protein TonB
MAASIVGFKVPGVDLHRKSPKIFFMSLFASSAIVAIVIHIPFVEEAHLEEKVERPPVIIHLENIPETRHAVKPSFPKLAIPLEIADEMIPDDITIESTELDLGAETTSTPPDVFVPDTVVPVEREEEEIFEFFAVEERPERINTIVPEFPDLAKRAGIDGVVFLKVLVNKKGAVDSVTVIKGPPVFHNSSVEAAKKTKFTPAKQNDRPVNCWVIMRFRFVLED